MSGIVNCDYYYDAQYQIAWILKETNSEDTTFDVCYWLDSYLPVDKKVPRRIAMASYGILNDEEDAYGYNVNNYDVKSSLKEIAWINISDYPGGSSTSYTRLKRLYQENRSEFWDKLDEANPNIIILCGTCSVLWDDLTGGYYDYNLNKLEFYDDSINTRAYLQEDDCGPLIIEVKHPSEREYNDRYYASQIIKAVRAWENNEYSLVEEW